MMNNQILLFASGSAEEINHTRDILNETKAINHTLHHGAGNFVSLSIMKNHGQGRKDYGQGLESESPSAMNRPAKTLDHHSRKEQNHD